FNSQYIAIDHPEHSSLTDSDLGRLVALRYLKRLDVGGNNRITDEGMAALGQLESLEDLSVACTSVTDRGIQALKGLSRLSALDVSRTGITDESLAVVETLPALTLLRAIGTHLSRDRLSRIRARRPRVRIVTSEIGLGVAGGNVE